MFNYTADELKNFEKDVIEIFREGILPFAIHFSDGNEDQLIEIFREINDDDYVFSTHRSHYHYLLKGGRREDLIDKIKNCKSMYVFDRRIKFITSSIVAGTCCIAAGVAFSLKLNGSPNKVWCFVGDGAEDEGHFYEAVRYVENMQLPCIFIIEDNDRSVGSSKELRGSAYSVPWPKCVRRYHYVATMPHGGPGLKEVIAFNKEVVDRYGVH
jgi:pyruvate dehydrogenase E1 component alpha subunit